MEIVTMILTVILLGRGLLDMIVSPLGMNNGTHRHRSRAEKQNEEEHAESSGDQIGKKLEFQDSVVQSVWR